MKILIYGMMLAMVLSSGWVCADFEYKSDPSIKSNPKPLSIAETKAARKKWEATPEGILFKNWETSAAGMKVQAGAAKIMNNIKNYSNMEGVVTSLSLPPGTRLGLAVMIQIKGNDYILAFGPEVNKEFELLHSLKVNDKIIIRSRSVSKAPKYSYPIVSGDLVERDGSILYKRMVRKGGC